MSSSGKRLDYFLVGRKNETVENSGVVHGVELAKLSFPRRPPLLEILHVADKNVRAKIFDAAEMIHCFGAHVSVEDVDKHELVLRIEDQIDLGLDEMVDFSQSARLGPAFAADEFEIEEAVSELSVKRLGHNKGFWEIVNAVRVLDLTGVHVYAGVRFLETGSGYALDQTDLVLFTLVFFPIHVPVLIFAPLNALFFRVKCVVHVSVGLLCMRAHLIV